ncbi:MAG: transglutaminase-like domain-containing protein [Pirellulales bacterium]
MRRRRFLTTAALGLAGVCMRHGLNGSSQSASPAFSTDLGPVHSIIPVVGDGKWIWKEPPEKDRGYLEPRSYELKIGIEMTGVGEQSEALAATPVPLAHPEQVVDDVRLEKEGCEATIRELAPGAGQLLMHVPALRKGETVRAIAHYKLTLSKQYHAYAAEMFPVAQRVPQEIKNLALFDSPGIQTSAPAVKKLAAELSQGIVHPWDKAVAFAAWIREHIRPQIGPFTSVTTALEKRLGDCEEYSAVFVALCRAAEIPARLVWVPNHNWSEFYLTDDKGVGHWIPVHTACYGWFGWTGVHELVIQKGDRVKVREQHATFRLLEDWLRSTGRKPQTTYVAELTPLPPKTDADPGPGAAKERQ